MGTFILYLEVNYKRTRLPVDDGDCWSWRSNIYMYAILMAKLFQERDATAPFVFVGS